MKIKKIFHVQPYGGWITCMITDKVKEESDKIGPGYKHNWNSVTHFGSNGNSKIVLGVERDNGIIAHEAIHAILHLFDNVGISIDCKNDEPFTYQVQWLIYKINSMYDRINKNAVAKKTPAKT